jgi:hypothetical protein
MTNDFSSPLGSTSLFMREEEKEMRDNVILLDDQPFDPTLVQLKMVSNNIMDKVRRKYELSPM